MIELQIYSLNGSIVLQQSKPVYTSGMQEFLVPIHKLSAGVYAYSIQIGKQIFSGKFMKFK
jgi:hypothetical protein